MTIFGPAARGVLLETAVVLLLIFLGLAVLCVIALLGIRGRRAFVARRRERETAALRADLVAVVVGEEPDASEAAARLVALRGRLRERADELLAGMLPKVRGDAKDRVRSVLRGRGAEDRAIAQLDSRRSFARCRGAFALGAMGDSDATTRIVPLLDDRSRLVRRVAARALGLMQDPRAAEALLNAANRPDAIQRDIVHALAQLDPAAAPVLRSRIVHFIAHPDPTDRSGPVAARALGFMGDAAAARILAAAIDGGTPALQLAAAQALGHLDVPIGVSALQRAVSPAATDQLQFAAATSLGRLGAESAIPELLDAVTLGDPSVSRMAASALLELGPSGRAALAASPAPYAVEAMAIENLRRES